MSDAGKKKPVKLEWKGGLVDSGPGGDASKVEIRGGKGRAEASKSVHSGVRAGTGNRPDGAAGATTPWVGNVQVRREVKGRGGKPVALVGAFAPVASPHQQDALCRALKERLACGGTREEGEIVLQVDDFARVAAALEKLGIKAKKGGGFAS